MKNLASVIVSLSGIILFLLTILKGGNLWGVILAVGLVLSPFTALAMLFSYLFMVGIPLIMILGFGYIGVQISGKDSFLAYVGIVVGGGLGFWFVYSKYFDYLFSESLLKVTKLDD